MAIVPIICADKEDALSIEDGTFINYYFGAIKNAAPIADISKDLSIASKKGEDIVMCHFNVPDDICKTYDDNKAFFPFVNRLGMVGVTIHCKACKHPNGNELLLEQMLRMQKEIPDVVWYVENEHNDMNACVSLVKALRDMGREAYVLLDTCHLMMDIAMAPALVNNPVDILRDIVEKYKRYIGAFHLSCSYLADGWIAETHGKPILNSKDEAYFRELCEMIRGIQSDKPVLVIPEVTEEEYSLKNERKNGKRAYEIIKEYALKGGITDVKRNKISA